MRHWWQIVFVVQIGCLFWWHIVGVREAIMVKWSFCLWQMHPIYKYINYAFIRATALAHLQKVRSVVQCFSHDFLIHTVIFSLIIFIFLVKMQVLLLNKIWFDRKRRCHCDWTSIKYASHRGGQTRRRLRIQNRLRVSWHILRFGWRILIDVPHWTAHLFCPFRFDSGVLSGLRGFPRQRSATGIIAFRLLSWSLVLALLNLLLQGLRWDYKDLAQIMLDLRFLYTKSRDQSF